MTAQPKAKVGDKIFADDQINGHSWLTVSEVIIREGVFKTHIRYRVEEVDYLINQDWVEEIKTAEEVEIDAYVEEKLRAYEDEQLTEQLSHFETESEAA